MRDEYLTILFVDDNRHVREFWQRELEREGYRVVLAPNGWEAIALLGQVPPDLVITDLRMPRLGGQALVKRMLRQNLKIPVIVYSAEVNAAREFALVPAVAFVSKTDDCTKLKNAIQWALTPSASAAKKGRGQPGPGESWSFRPSSVSPAAEPGGTEDAD